MPFRQRWTLDATSVVSLLFLVAATAALPPSGRIALLGSELLFAASSAVRYSRNNLPRRQAPRRARPAGRARQQPEAHGSAYGAQHGQDRPAHAGRVQETHPAASAACQVSADAAGGRPGPAPWAALAGLRWRRRNGVPVPGPGPPGPSALAGQRGAAPQSPAVGWLARPRWPAPPAHHRDAQARSLSMYDSQLYVEPAGCAGPPGPVPPGSVPPGAPELWPARQGPRGAAAAAADAGAAARAAAVAAAAARVEGLMSKLLDEREGHLDLLRGGGSLAGWFHGLDPQQLQPPHVAQLLTYLLTPPPLVAAAPRPPRLPTPPPDATPGAGRPSGADGGGDGGMRGSGLQGPAGTTGAPGLSLEGTSPPCARQAEAADARQARELQAHAARLVACLGLPASPAAGPDVRCGAGGADGPATRARLTGLAESLAEAAATAATTALPPRGGSAPSANPSHAVPADVRVVAGLEGLIASPAAPPSPALVRSGPLLAAPRLLAAATDPLVASYRPLLFYLVTESIAAATHVALGLMGFRVLGTTPGGTATVYEWHPPRPRRQRTAAAAPPPCSAVGMVSQPPPAAAIPATPSTVIASGSPAAAPAACAGGAAGCISGMSDGAAAAAQRMAGAWLGRVVFRRAGLLGGSAEGLAAAGGGGPCCHNPEAEPSYAAVHDSGAMGLDDRGCAGGPHATLGDVPAGPGPAHGAAVLAPADAQPEEPPLVLLHGIGLGLTPYLRVLRRLAAAAAVSPGGPRRRLLAVQYKHVSMRLTATIPAPHEVAADLAALLNGLGVPSVSLLAHSYGTLVASALNKLGAAGAGPAVVRLTLVDPVCFAMFLPHLTRNTIYQQQQQQPVQRPPGAAGGGAGGSGTGGGDVVAGATVGLVRDHDVGALCDGSSDGAGGGGGGLPAYADAGLQAAEAAAAEAAAAVAVEAASTALGVGDRPAASGPAAALRRLLVRRLLRGLVVAEFHCSVALRRRLDWSAVNAWPSELPAATTVVLAGRDNLVPVAEVRHILATRARLLGPAAPRPTVLLHPYLGHGGFLTDPAWQCTVLAAALGAGAGAGVQDKEPAGCSASYDAGTTTPGHGARDDPAAVPAAGAEISGVVAEGQRARFGFPPGLRRAVLARLAAWPMPEARRAGARAAAAAADEDEVAAALDCAPREGAERRCRGTGGGPGPEGRSALGSDPWVMDEGRSDPWVTDGLQQEGHGHDRGSPAAAAAATADPIGRAGPASGEGLPREAEGEGAARAAAASSLPSSRAAPRRRGPAPAPALPGARLGGGGRGVELAGRRVWRTAWFRAA